MSTLLSASGQPIDRDRLGTQDAAQRERIGVSVADVARPFPKDWLARLREESPVSTVHSYLIPYWYRPAERWVLYQGMPVGLIREQPERPVCPGFTGDEFLLAVSRKAPRDLHPEDRTPYLSDVQYEMYRRYNVYAAPFWVLQGDHGGHQVSFGPLQQELLAAQRLPLEPPQVGTLPACPFDQRVVDRLRALNRLRQLHGNLDVLRKTGSKEGGDAITQHYQRQIREAELAFLEEQMADLLDAAQTVSHRADSREHLMYVQPGTAGAASEALQVYRETGDFIL